MGDFKEKLKKPEFINWIRGTLGLEQTKKAAQDYVKEKFRLYTQGTARLQPDQTHFTQQERSHIIVVGHHIRRNLKSAVNKDRNSRVLEWKTSNRYSCAECKGAFEKILSLRRKTYKGDIHYHNSDSTMNISLEWAIAKIFMPQGNGTNNGPEETDAYAMFHMMGICTLFLNPIRETHMVKLKEARNSLCHSPNNEVTDQVLKTYFEHMIGLLQDASNDIEVDQAIREKICTDMQGIDELKNSDLAMTLLNDADKALRLKRKAIFNDFETSLHDNDPEVLRKLLPLAEQVGGDIQGLKQMDESRINQILVHIDKLTEIKREAASLRDGIKNLKQDEENKQSEILKIANDTKIKIENELHLWENNAAHQTIKVDEPPSPEDKIKPSPEDNEQPSVVDSEQPSVADSVQDMGLIIIILATIALAIFLRLCI